MNRNTKVNIFGLFYWAIPLVLWGLQVVFTLTSMSQLRAEELGNGVRVPFWLAHRTIHTLATNVGWDGAMVLIYQIFGFDLFAGKYFRLALQLVSLFCLAYLLKKYLGPKLAWFPLLTIGLSPTLLFFVSFQSQYGIDLQYLPIVLFLLLSNLSYLRYLSWALAMIAWLSYPTFVFYLPALFLFHLGGVKAHRFSVRYPAHPRGVLALVGSLVAFLAPLAAAFIYVENRQLLLWDPATETGIFRGGGGKFFQPGTIDSALQNLFSDLFVGGVSYNFDLKLSEFSLVFPVVTLSLVLALFFVLYKRAEKPRLILLLLALVLIFNLSAYLLVSDSTGIPGLRRATPSLAAFYALFTVVWYFTNKSNWPNLTNWVIKGALVLLLFHHAIVFPGNLAGLKAESRYSEKYWLGEDPYPSFQEYLTRLQKEDVYLKCERLEGVDCRYGDAYATLAAACLWNHLKCNTIYGLDPLTGKYIPLTRSLWDNGYLQR